MLAKGLLPLVLLGPPVAAVMLGGHGWAGVRRLRPGLGCLVVTAVVLPWHALAAWRNPGFAWDFVVNQHLLFAFDKKEPRDSEGISLVLFLGAFLGRAAPRGRAAAVGAAWRTSRAGASADRDAEIVFEAPIEYQLVGGLDFYLARDVTLLEPAAGFVPPTYPQGRVEEMFIDRTELERRWRRDAPVVFVSDPTRRRVRPAGLVPEPFVVLAHFGNRWVLGNQAVAP